MMKTCLSTIVIATVLLAMNAGVFGALGVDTPSPELPPPGVYISPLEYHEYSAMGIVLDDPAHYPHTQGVLRERVGDDELETFDSEFTAVEIGQGFGPMSLTGPVVVRTFDRALSTAGTFDTEIVSMSLSGSSPLGPIMIRQDPSRASLGVTDIFDLGGGLYHIDSFFDVFTELSVDGGASWVGCDYSTHMYLVPEPATVGLLMLGGLALLRKRRT